MNRKIKKMMVIVLTMMTLCCASITAFAHSCSCTELGGTYLLFAYSDGTVVKGGKIIIQDENGDTIATSKTDRDGIYNYEEYVDTAAKIVMNDGEGHVAEYEIPDEIPPVTDQTPVKSEEPAQTNAAQETEPAEAPVSGGMNAGTIAAVVIVVAALIAVAVLFSKKGKKKV